ncbi:bHLH transcription factor-like protein [Choanephora cucurbitarum]|nr:bHLH transcription factor-like protein [Choanephora cucurbitarum]
MHREGERPYSSNHKLRVSHKLAERKRRRKIKNLVDALKSALPVDKSIKISKWEILSRGNYDCK